MAALDFPDTPTVGQVYDKWTWNGTLWVLTAGAGGGGSGFTFVQDTKPTPNRVGDTWFDTSTAASGGTSWTAIEEAPGGEKVWVQFAPGSGSIATVPRVGITLSKQDTAVANNAVTVIPVTLLSASGGFISTGNVATIPKAGVYSCSLFAQWASSPGQTGWVGMAAAGLNYRAGAGGDPNPTCSLTLAFPVGATINMHVYQFSGATLNLQWGQLHVNKVSD